MAMKQILSLWCVLLLVVPIAYTHATDKDINSKKIKEEIAATFDLSPYNSNATVKMAFSNPYLQREIDASESQSLYAMPVEPIPKNVGAAIAETVRINIMVWAFGQYVMGQESGAHSYINLDTMRDNLTL
jgi:hypothetical protein